MIRMMALCCAVVGCAGAAQTPDECRAEVDRRARKDAESECTPGTVFEECEQVIIDRAAVERKACR